ncbi:MAG: DUF4253 domain-containing protein [Candidatus Kapaibacterium sp.]
MELTTAERALAARIGMDPVVLMMVKGEGDLLAQLECFGNSANRALADGVSILVNGGPEAQRQVKRLAALLNPEGYQVFTFALQRERGRDRIGILKSTDQWDILRCRGSNGGNYDIDCDDLLVRLQEWDRRFGLKITGADLSWVEAEFIHPPEDFSELANEVYEFVPDVVDQGTGRVEDLALSMKLENVLFLWWD